MFILGYGIEPSSLFVPSNQKISGVSQTEQIAQYILDKLNDAQIKDVQSPRTPEARIVSGGMDKLPKAQREQALAVVRAMFAQYADYFKDGDEDEA